MRMCRLAVRRAAACAMLCTSLVQGDGAAAVSRGAARLWQPANDEGAAAAFPATRRAGSVVQQSRLKVGVCAAGDYMP